LTAGLLSLLAPDASDPAKLEACVQLVRSLARGVVERGETFDIDVARAEVEYEQEVRATAIELCGDLFHLHLASLTRGPDSPRGSGFESWTEPKVRARGAWKALLELEGRGLDLALPGLPEPGEAAASVAARILAAAECLGVGAATRALWRAHLTAADQGPVVGAEAYRVLLDGDEMPFELLEAAHLGLLGCHLARGAVRRAEDWINAHMDLAAVSPRLMRLAGWVQLAAGDVDAAAEFLSPMPRASLPGPIVALGDRLPAFRELLAGSSEWREGEPAALVPWAGLRRGDVGACALCLVELTGRGTRLVHAELAPGLGHPGADWLDRQQVAPFEEGEPEFELLRSQAPVVVFPDAGGEPHARRWSRGCLSARCRGLALVPLFKEGGRTLAGWIRVEFEHLLVPELERLERLAQVVGRRLGFGAVRPLPEAPICPSAERLITDALAGFAMGRRRWWGLALVDGKLRVVASSGTSLENWEQRFGGMGLARACLEANRPMPSGLEERDFVHRDARAGVAIPLVIEGGSLRFALAIESTRAGDLGTDEVTALLEGRRGDLRGLGAALEAAAFDQAHRQVFGEEVRFAAGPPTCGPGEVAALLLDESLRPNVKAEGPQEALARLGKGPVLLSGSAGCGKRTLARLRAFRNGEPLHEVRARSLDRRRFSQLKREGGATLIRDIEDLGEDVQVQLLEAIEGGRCDAFVLTTRLDPQDLGHWARLTDHLTNRTLHLAGLDKRRAELPQLFEVGLRRAARAQGTLPPALTDCAAAVVWRQTWRRGLHEVMDLARRLVPLAHGKEINAAELIQLAGTLGWQLSPKLDSRAPDLAALWQALDTTRKRGGGFHRGRAAALLGWDPDTLAARLKRLR